MPARRDKRPLAHRINPLKPERSYRLDLSLRDHREMCAMLVRLAVVEPVRYSFLPCAGMGLTMRRVRERTGWTSPMTTLSGGDFLQLGQRLCHLQGSCP